MSRVKIQIGWLPPQSHGETPSNFWFNVLQQKKSPSLVVKASNFALIKGWPQEDFATALRVFQSSAKAIIAEAETANEQQSLYQGCRADWLPACFAALETDQPQDFFEKNFFPLEIEDKEIPKGHITGYYEPEVIGSLCQTAEFSVPLYRKPDDLVLFTREEQQATGLSYGRRCGGRATAYFTRKEIDEGVLAHQGLEILWLRDPVEAFFIHIQGSARVTLTTGSVRRLNYAAKSGLPYFAIGRELIKRGILQKQEISMQSIMAWLKNNPALCREILWCNPSYIFFNMTKDCAEYQGALGTQKIPLTPLRSLAVDQSRWRLGTPFWIETVSQTLEARPSSALAQLFIAQDTGSALQGYARGDIYWGWGEKAALHAGHMNRPAKFTLLLPQGLAQKIMAMD